MATKAQISRKIYGTALSNLSSGQKAAVTRAFNAQDNTVAEDTVVTETASEGFVVVEFGRPGVNGVKKSIVKEGTPISDALAQTGMIINTKKEGIIVKVSGDKVMLNDAAIDGTLYLIVPGVDSSM